MNDSSTAARQRTYRATHLEWEQTRSGLRNALRDLLPASRVVVFGSLVRRGIFNAASDIDLALFDEPKDKSVWCLQADLEERLRRPVDVVLLRESRLRQKILRDGEIWMT
jgi:predicted nucleotidyltransferase